MKKIISFLKNDYVQGTSLCSAVLVFLFTSGFYGVDMFIMYHNPMHLIMVLLAIAFSIPVLHSLFLNLRLGVYYPIKKSIKTLIAKW
tara:strand:+ start:320 stop:580 length:261 start_codon:yes stop_codon:yes gene_type:complete